MTSTESKVRVAGEVIDLKGRMWITGLTVVALVAALAACGFSTLI